MGFRIPSWATCVVYFLAATAAHAATIAVPAGGDLQAALNAAQPGDVITLEPGATYTGNFILPNKALPDNGDTPEYITIRSAAPDEVFPPFGVRMTPAYAAHLPKIKSPNALWALQTATSAHHYKLMFLEFQANVGGANDIITLGANDSTQTELTQVPYAFILDRLYVHGDPELGQKRGIALHSRDTTVINSWVSDCKAIGQESQAIGGFNGPGHYVIENNYLEAATQSFLLGGADPPIKDLVTTNVVFRYNYLTKPLAWRDPILAAPANVAAAATPAAGALPAGTYYYKVVARKLSYRNNIAASVASAEVTATLDADGAVTISWTPVATAREYLVYGRTSNSQAMFWTTSDPFFTDTGAAGAAGKPGSGTKWMVKNSFELKNAQDVLVEGNVFEHVWVADQPGYPILFTPRNQNGTAPWVVVQRVMFRNNLVRHTSGGVNILGTDNLAPSQRTRDITIVDNVFDDLTASIWGSSRVFLIGDGADNVTIDHNTIISTQPAIYYLYGRLAGITTPITNLTITNNMSAHNSFGFFGDRFSSGLSAFNAYMLPNGIFCRNVLAGGNAKVYLGLPCSGFDNYFPTVADWQLEFVDFAGGNYHLRSNSTYKNAGVLVEDHQVIGPDGKDLGADVDVVLAETTLALFGDIRLRPGMPPVHIGPPTVPKGMFNVPYEQRVTCSGGLGGCAIQVLDSSLPDGLAFDAASGLITGTPAAPTVGLLILRAYDTAWDFNEATITLEIMVDPPPYAISIPEIPAGKVGEPFHLAPSVSGALGTVAWSVASGNLPDGLSLDPLSGEIAGTPTMWGTKNAVIQATDSDRWGLNRVVLDTVTITVAPAPIQIVTSALPAGVLGSHYDAALSATGGTGVQTWSLIGGLLPPGLVLGTIGSVTGDPQSIGRFAFTVQVKDDWPGYTDSGTATLVIAPLPIAITTATLPSGNVPRPYRAVLEFTGGTGHTTWSLVEGQLPKGLELSPDGIISGEPKAVGAFSFTVQASDVGWDGNVARRTFSLTIRAREVVLYASDANMVTGTWSIVPDATAADGSRMWNPNKSAKKIDQPLANPANYFEIPFQAEAGVAYHLWLRGKADRNKRVNDAVMVQFSGSVDQAGTPNYRIGTISATEVNLADCNGCHLSGWGWQDNGWGVNVMGPSIYFEQSGAQTIRVQVKEDGFSIDQIVLSAEQFLRVAPGALKNDRTLVLRDGSRCTMSLGTEPDAKSDEFDPSQFARCP
jgi:Putative Ig domain